MSRTELVEWIVIIGTIVAWWPRIFLGYDPLWYHILIYYVSLPVLVIILVRRFRANEAGFRVSEEMLKAQRGGRPVDISEAASRQKPDRGKRDSKKGTR
ncbi:MAG TPA: hypothetical protein DGT21_00230 [Armatimonadetes bacterium]|nr:hypothetical protein [Armatimonadota bacterium]